MAVQYCAELSSRCRPGLICMSVSYYYSTSNAVSRFGIHCRHQLTRESCILQPCLLYREAICASDHPHRNGNSQEPNTETLNLHLSVSSTCGILLAMMLIRSYPSPRSRAFSVLLLGVLARRIYLAAYSQYHSNMPTSVSEFGEATSLSAAAPLKPTHSVISEARGPAPPT